MNATDDDSPVCHASRAEEKKLIQIYSPRFANTRVVQNDLQPFLYFSQNQQQMYEIFSVVNSERPARYCRVAGTIRFLAHAQTVVKNGMAG
jgi:hypothetical protein